MKIAQKSYLEVEKDGKLVQLVVDADMPLGLIFDALMELKGYAVERMTAAHAEEAAEAERQMGAPEQEEKEEDNGSKS
tara:strand:+ start:33 stop:266 length:234 start_codon:yes stop_codon:yes gene_type:complete